MPRASNVLPWSLGTLRGRVANELKCRAARMALVVGLAWLALAGRTARAEVPAATPEELDESAAATPSLDSPPALGTLVGRIISAVDVKLLGDRWLSRVELRSVHRGDRLSPALARRALRELADTGHFARISASAEASGDTAILRITALPRRVIASVNVEGGSLDEEALLREAHIAVDGEVTALSLPQMNARIASFYARHGYRHATVDIDVRETDDPAKVALLVRIRPNDASRITRRIFVHDGPPYSPDLALDAELLEIQQHYAGNDGQEVDEERLTLADRALTDRLRAADYHRARVRHQLVVEGAYTFLYVRIDPGPKFVTRYEGLYHFDASEVDRALALDEELDKGIRHLAAKVADFYVRRGFLDVEVDAEERGEAEDRVHVLLFRVREHDIVRVVAHEFPCLNGGPLSAADAAREINSFLVEELPGSGLLGSVDPSLVDAMHGPSSGAGNRATPLQLDPRATYVPEIYDRAIKHLQDYYHSQGFLSAMVGPLEIVRRRCDRRSPPGQCIAVEPPVRPHDACLYDSEGIPVEEPEPDRRLRCQPDPQQGISCEPFLRTRIPIKLGPRTSLYDIAFEGNRILVEQDLAEKADLKLGAPVSQTEIDAARGRILDAFKEEGFAFADVRVVLDFSADRTRARARFVISEGERVYVDGIVLRGAKRTSPGLILKRVTLERCPLDWRLDQCKPYRASEVRKSEERIATLGTFSSVSISLEDPQVPARRKVVIVEVQERMPQYLDLRPGFSTGEGFRATFEYGHRNVVGRAIQFTLRAQLGYLPDSFTLDPQVRDNLDTLSVAERLERRDTISVLLPEIGLGPLVRLGLDGIDVRDNARDYGLSKEAAVATFTYSPIRSFYAHVGGSLERNQVKIFRGGTVECYLQDIASQGGAIADLSRLLRVPDGLTFAVSQRFSASWDRRDNPLGATRGTLLLGSVEHVHAYRVGSASPTTCETEASTRPGASMLAPEQAPSDFLRLTGTAAGYVRLTPRGLAIAVSLRGGRIVQLVSGSKTYPDRLFFMGGVDSLRGFLQDSLVPQDIAERILNPTDPNNPLKVENVAIRGGDVFINPRVELRIPLGDIWEAGIFMDTGNLWVEPKNFQPFLLRYTAGAGLRIATPVGPIAFDYGINLITRSALKEDRGNFHFSIGLF